MKVTIYTDGAARGNPEGPGGYGTILQYVDQKGNLHEKELSGGYIKTTNNRMELMAVIAGLEALNRPCEAEVISDSKYVTDAFNKHWIDGWLKKNWKGASGPVKKRRPLETPPESRRPSHRHLYLGQRPRRPPRKRTLRHPGHHRRRRHQPAPGPRNLTPPLDGLYQ